MLEIFGGILGEIGPGVVPGHRHYQKGDKMDKITIHVVPLTVSQPPVEEYKLADTTGVLHDDGTPTDAPVTYATVDAALDAGEALFAVGEFYNQQKITAITRIGDERLELTVGEG